MSTFRKSQVRSVPITQGSQFSTTNQLYRPLKETLQHPEIVRQHAQLTPVIAQNSLVSKEFRRLNTLELQNIEKNIYVPDGELIPTNNLNLVRGEKFYAVDATEKIAGPPISAEQLERIRRNGMKTSQIVYQVKEPEVYHEKQVSNLPPKDTYTPPPYDSYGKNTEQFKYNLFSCIDKPFNQCRQFGCGKCSGCPSNEIIASQNYPNSFLRSSRA